MSATRHPSSFALDAMLQGVLAGDEHALVEAHLVKCDRCRASIAASTADRERFTRFVFPSTIDAVRAPRRRWSWAALAWAGVPALLIVAVWFGVRPLDPRAGSLHPVEPVTPAAGPALRAIDVRLRAFALEAATSSEHTPEHVRELADRDVVHEGELVRLSVESARLPFVLVLVVDATGKVSLLGPVEGGESLPLRRNERAELAASWLVEPGSAPARVYALFSGEPIASASVRRAVAQSQLRGAALLAADRLTIPAMLDGQRVEIAAQRSLLLRAERP